MDCGRTVGNLGGWSRLPSFFLQHNHQEKTVLEETSEMDKDDERWEAKIKVLNEIVEHHIKEEGEVFKIARKALDKERIQEVARQIQQEKNPRTQGL